MNTPNDPAGTGDAPPTPIARVRGDPIVQLPVDLYIPPDALEVILETFQGPLDLLLYLIRKENLDILDIPIAEVTRQYMGYIELMQVLKLELAAEYLLMAAVLIEIKSRLLLPRPPPPTPAPFVPGACAVAGFTCQGGASTPVICPAQRYCPSGAANAPPTPRSTRSRCWAC